MTRSIHQHLSWNGLSNRPVKIWVLAPLVASGDEHLDYYYDFTQSILEYTHVFDKLQLNWKWQPVRIDDFKHIISLIHEEKQRGDFFPIVLNLCDGDEINGTPGVSVIAELEKNGLIYTGSDSAFYNVTTSKIPMKKAFDANGVANAPWRVISEQTAIDQLFQEIGKIIIVKPAVSGGSMGVGVKNVISNKTGWNNLIASLQEGYRGWNLMADGLIAEAFIIGEEYTALVCGHHEDPENIDVYDPVERIFHHSLPEEEKFLSFERLWEIYENETAMPNNDNFYEYTAVDKEISESIKQLTKEAFIATGGVGYARADIRRDKTNGKLYMLEINAQCGISEDENFTSIGAILRFAGVAFHELINQILHEALKRHSKLVLEEKQRSLSTFS